MKIYTINGIIEYCKYCYGVLSVRKGLCQECLSIEEGI